MFAPPTAIYTHGPGLRDFNLSILHLKGIFFLMRALGQISWSELYILDARYNFYILRAVLNHWNSYTLLFVLICFPSRPRLQYQHIANSLCHCGSYDRSFWGPYNIFLVTDRSIYCHMTRSVMNYLLYYTFYLK
jgi:hypothetical protein